MSKIDYERKDYKKLAKEFGCHLRIGKYGVKFLPRTPENDQGKSSIYKLVQITPLNGWITDPVEVERLIRENGMEL